MKKWFIALAAVSVAGLFLWYKYKIPKYIIGEVAADFTAQLADGSSAKLSDLRGKYVLLQFWGSWCGPCRAENPGLVRVFQKFHEKRFEIFSVGIEQNPSRWQKAIEKDSMVWRFHTMEAGDFSGPIAKQYGVWQIPSTWLIDPSGTVIGVNFTPENIEKTLESNL